jgi:hypothetical protein
MNFPFNVFGFTFKKIFYQRFSICFTNSGHKFSSVIPYKFCRSFSSSDGLTRVAQSHSLKKCLINLQIRFLASIFSLPPFYSARLFSKYSFEFMILWYSSSSFKEKSLTTHKNLGKYFWISSGSHSPIASFFILNYFDRLMISERF